MTPAAALLETLSRLVAGDTRNPPRHVTADLVTGLVADSLDGFDVSVVDHGAGSVSLHAVRGSPDVLFNCHLDTVPVAEGWTKDPLRLTVEGGRAFGLGACDVKGSAACLLEAARATSGPAAILLTTDEEGGTGQRCVREFLRGDHGYRRAVVCEPTGCRAVLAHRGIGGLTMTFGGVPGHASSARAADDSAVHRAARWTTAALDLAASLEGGEGDLLPGIRFNVGVFAGGLKPNMIAGLAEVKCGFRPGPTHADADLASRFVALARPEHVVSHREHYRGPPLPPGGDAAARLGASRALAARLGLGEAPAVDFWTEAALFSDAGLDTVVFGPGSIGQAHAADEWVAVDELVAAADVFVRAFS